MKKLYIIMLAVLAVPMCASAQDAPEHLFPAITFHVVGNDVEYTVPAWDAKASKGERVQRTEVTNPGGGGDEPGPGGPGSPGPNVGDEDAVGVEYNGIIVASACGIRSEDIGETNNARAAYTINDENDSIFPAHSNIVINGVEYDPVTVTYGDILVDFDPDLGEEKLFSTDYVSGNYVIPSTAEPFEQDEYASKYNIVGLGDNAYWNWNYNTSGVKFKTVVFRAKSLTIPAHIKFLGRRCFQGAGVLTKVEIADDSEIEVLPYGCFAHGQRLREINIPASVSSIEEHALGGLRYLGKIVFAADETPTVHENAFVKIGTSGASEVVKANCAIWVNSMNAVRNFRTANSSMWNVFPFCYPLELKKQLISYCSDLVLSHQYLVLGTGTTGNTWALYEDSVNALGGEHLRLYYVNKQKQYLDPSYDQENGQYTIKLLQMKENPAKPGFGLLITGDPGIHEMYVKPEGTSGNTTKNNLLVGTLEATDMTSIINDAQNDIYLLKDGTFYRCTGGTLAANKAYLKLPKDTFDGIRTTDAKEINIEFGQEGDDTDGIVAIDNSQLTIDNVYDLSGRKVAENAQLSTLPKGIYIVNGKKYILK